MLKAYHTWRAARAAEEKQRAVTVTKFERYPLGHRFTYLGVEVQVVEHRPPLQLAGIGSVPSFSQEAAIVIDYVDEYGVIRTKDLNLKGLE